MNQTELRELPSHVASEEDLITGLQLSDKHSFAKLYDKFSGAIYSVIINWVKDIEVAENLLQDVFVKAWFRRNLYDSSKGRLFTWLYKISRHVCIDHYRSRRHKQDKSSVLSEDMTIICTMMTMNSPLSDAIGIRSLVNLLRKEEKEIIELAYFKGYTQQEIAQVLSMPIGTVKTRVRIAISKLRQFFAKDWRQAIQLAKGN